MDNSTSDVKQNQEISPPNSFLRSFRHFSQSFHNKVWGDSEWAQSIHDKVWGRNDYAYVKNEQDVNKK